MGIRIWKTSLRFPNSWAGGKISPPRICSFPRINSPSRGTFTFTANQEKEHAEIFYNHLKELSGETIVVDGGYPVDIYPDVKQLLLSAQHNEYEEYDPIYKVFGDKAKEEGFDKVAASFHMISAIEKTHGDRFGKFAQLMEQNKLFISDVETGWICLNCGYVYTGTNAPEKCPVCDHDKGYFIRLSMSPFSE